MTTVSPGAGGGGGGSATDPASVLGAGTETRSAVATSAMTATAAGTKTWALPLDTCMGHSRRRGNRLLEIAPWRARRNPNCYGGGESVVLRTEPPVDEITQFCVAQPVSPGIAPKNDAAE